MDTTEAEALAARVLAAIDADPGGPEWLAAICAADRERVASDLAGLRQHIKHAPPYDDLCDYCSHVPEAVEWPCLDARRYADGLRRTAALYGVTCPRPGGDLCTDQTPCHGCPHG